MENIPWNPWKLTTFAALFVLATALVSGLVVASRAPSQTTPAAAPSAASPAPMAAPPAPAAEPPPPAAAARSQVAGGRAMPAPDVRPVRTAPTQSDVGACNRYASTHVGQRDQTWAVAKDAIIGGAATAGLGAAAGAIAGGGRGAGKGAAIGGLVGAAGGALYGINENRQADEAYRGAYARCMRSRGFGG